MSKDKKQKQKEKHEHGDRFIHDLRILIKEAMTFIPEDPRIYRVNKRIMLAIQVEPGIVINKVGELLYKYRDFIYDASTEDLLIQWDFSKDIIADDKESEDVSILVISELKRALQAMTDTQKKYYRETIINLLDSYLEYKCD